jgi:hypothetical protein
MADEEDVSLLEDAMDRLIGKGIVVDQSRCGPGFGHTEEATKGDVGSRPADTQAIADNKRTHARNDTGVQESSTDQGGG